MLFGTTPEEARTSIMADALGAGFRQSVWMVADELGFDLDPDLRTTHEMAVATAADRLAHRADRARARSPRSASAGRASSTASRSITAAVNWLMGEEHLDPAWTFGAEGERFEVEVDRRSRRASSTFKKLHPDSIEAGLERNPGIVATAMHCVNAIPYVCAAEPGLLTYLDLPLVAGRASAALGRGRARHDPRPLPPRRTRSRSSPAAGKGIGRGIAIGFAEAGRRRRRRGADTRPTSTRSPRQVEALGATGAAVVHRRDATRRISTTLVEPPSSEFGRLDVLVNNAGGHATAAGDVTPGGASSKPRCGST